MGSATYERATQVAAAAAVGGTFAHRIELVCPGVVLPRVGSVDTMAAPDQPTPPSRILIVVQNLPVPYDRRVWLEATSLVSAGHEVVVICPATPDYPERFEEIEGVEIHRFGVPVDARGAIGYASEFAICLTKVTQIALRLRKQAPFDVLHACNPPEIYWVLARLLRRLDGTKFIFDHHDLSPEMFIAKFDEPNRWLHKGLLWLERMTYRTADHALVTNESYRRIVTGRTGFASDDVTTVRSGPSTARFAIVEPDPELKAGKEHLLVYLGEIGEQDGVENLIEALVHLRHRDDTHCLLIGDGPHLPVIRALAAERGVEHLMTFAGRVSDDRQLSSMLSTATVGLVPDPNTDWSRFSTMNKVMEYMFFAMPVVAFDLVETRFSAEDAAVYAAPDDPMAFAAAIGELLDDPERRSEMGRAARKRLLEKLSWEQSVPNLLEGYRRTLAGRRAG